MKKQHTVIQSKVLASIDSLKQNLKSKSNITPVDISKIFNIYQNSHVDLNKIYENLPGSIQGNTNSDIEQVLTSKYESASIRHTYHLFYFICLLYLNHDNSKTLNVNKTLKEFLLISKSENLSILDLIFKLASNETVSTDSSIVYILQSNYNWSFNTGLTSTNVVTLSDNPNENMRSNGKIVIGHEITSDTPRLERLLLELMPEKLTSTNKKEKEELEVNHINSEITTETPDFFIVGIPRTGTSLLSSILNTHPNVYCAQDSGVFNEFSDTMRTIIQLQKVSRKELHTEQANNIRLVLDTSFGELINSTKIDPNDAESKLLLSLYLSNLFRFYLHDYTIPDPRKDRDTGEQYFSKINLDIVFDLILNKGITFVDLFNLLISFLSSSPKTLKLIGEKTPIGAVRNDYINTIYPNAKFINIIRHPIGYYGSRSQRLDVSVEDHCNFYKIGFDNMRFEGSNVITVRYEDLINEPNSTMLSIFKFLNIEPIDVEEEFQPGVYNKYVGKNIDKGRDNKNIELVPEETKDIIKSRLKDIITRFYE